MVLTSEIDRWHDQKRTNVIFKLFKQIDEFCSCSNGFRVDIRDVVPGAAPMLMSYDGGRHYDSIVDHDYQSRLCSQDPGQLENQLMVHYQSMSVNQRELNNSHDRPQVLDNIKNHAEDDSNKCLSA